MLPVPPRARNRGGVTLPTGHLVGRADELGSLERLLDELDRGCPGAVEVAGAPGIGKTRLLREVAAWAGARGHLVLSGAASEFERDPPFSVFIDALDEYVAGLEPARLAVLDDAVQAELAHVFPSLSALADGREVAAQSERYRSHRAVRELLERLAAPTPLVLVLDDLHWADSASVELLGALLRRPPAAAVLVAVALRPRQTPERLSAALERAHRAAALTRIGLGALTPLRPGSFSAKPLTPPTEPPCTSRAAATPSTWSSSFGRLSAPVRSPPCLRPRWPASASRPPWPPR